jgi:hypothetical protein
MKLAIKTEYNNTQNNDNVNIFNIWVEKAELGKIRIYVVLNVVLLSVMASASKGSPFLL